MALTTMAPRINLQHRLARNQAEIEITIDLEAPAFELRHVRALKGQLAGFLGLPPPAIRILGIARWQPIVTFEMPRAHAARLVRAFDRSDRRLLRRLRDPSVESIVSVSPADLGPRRRLPAFRRPLVAVNVALLLALIAIGYFRLSSWRKPGFDVSSDRAGPAPSETPAPPAPAPESRAEAETPPRRQLREPVARDPLTIALEAPDPLLALLVAADLPASPTTQQRAALARRLGAAAVPRAVLRVDSGAVHSGAVLDVDWSADGRRILTTSTDGTIRVFRADGAGDPEVRSLPAAPLDPGSGALFAYHAGRMRAAAGSSVGVPRPGEGGRRYPVSVWNLDDPDEPLPKCLRYPLLHDAVAVDLIWSGDGDRLAVVRGDGSVEIHCPEPRPTVLRLPDRRMVRAAWSRDDRRLATLASDGTAQVWLSFVRPGRDAVFSPDSRHFAMSARDTGGEHSEIWPVGGRGRPRRMPGVGPIFNSDGRHVATRGPEDVFLLDLEEPTGRVLRLSGVPGDRPSFSPDGRRLLIQTLEAAEVRSLDGSLVASFPQCGAAQAGGLARFSPDGARIACTGADRRLRVVTIATGESVALDLPRAMEQETLIEIAWSAAGALAARMPSHVAIWPAVAGGRPPAVWPGGRFAWSPDGSRWLSYDPEPGNAGFWIGSSAGAGEPTLWLEEPVRSAAWSPDGRWLLVILQSSWSRWEQRVHLRPVDRDAEALELTWPWEGIPEHGRFSADGSRLLLVGSSFGSPGAYEEIGVWRAEQPSELGALPPHTTHLADAALSPDNRWALTRVEAPSGDRIHLWRLDGPRVLRAGDDRLAAAAWSAAGVLATTSTGGAVHLWRPDDRPLEEPVALQLRGAALPAVWSPGGERVLTFGEGGDFAVHRLNGGPPLVFEGHEAPVTAAAWSATGSAILSTSEDGTARLWDSATARQLMVLRGHRGAVRAGAWGIGAEVATASDDGTVRIWPLSSRRREVLGSRERPWPSWQRELRAMTTACLTAQERVAIYGESPAPARAGYETCERRHRRTPRPEDGLDR